ncbi:(d)CMP kinase [Hoylesella shahii]|uniref:(d)CMP kinase n=1 Tax=Hoylesella shahii TaxID=228603 RepID=UPI0035ABED1C
MRKEYHAKMLAKEVGYIYVDTGAMYRAVTLFAMRNGMIAPNGEVNRDELKQKMQTLRVEFKLNEQTGRAETYLNGENVENEIRGMEVSSHVSAIAAIDFVRTALVEQQQRMGRDKGIVMDGRDIGTVVFPDAELKVFVTASAEIRAQRRFDELKGKGVEANFDEILNNVQQRDYIDSHREVSPLRKADDAIELDNGELTIAQQLQWLVERFEERVAQ